MTFGAVSAKPPLSGVRVLDLSRILPGPFASMVLSDLGAEVTNVVMPKMIDPLLAWFPSGPAHAMLSATLYRGKKSAVINFKKEEGRRLVLRLAKQADVFIEGFRAGTLSKIGLGYRDIVRVNPKIIYCSLSGYGQTGPMRHWASHDINYLAYAGLLSLVGEAGRPPVLAPLPIGDIGGGSLFAAIAVIAALYERKISGRGQFVDAAILDGLFSWMFLPYAEHLANGGLKRGCLQLAGRDPFYGVYETADGRHLAVGAVEMVYRERLLTLVGREDLKQYLGDIGRWEFLRKELSTILKTKTLEQWRAILEGPETCVSPVLTLDEALTNDHLQARGRVRKGALPMIGHPFAFSRSKIKTRLKPFRVGRDTLGVLRGLGLKTERINDLRRKRIVQ
ncbi:MAG: CoA transferase [Elusimicrobia bacterium]|nr:CoA transferase [Elusimicrobiota bacterium]